MLTIHIVVQNSSEAAVLSVTEVCIHGGVMHSDGSEIARYSAGAWDFGPFDVISIPIDCDAKIRFSNSDGHRVERGPFESIRIVDGAIRAGAEGSNQLLALLDHASAKWRIRDGTEWDSVTIRRPHRFD